ncbi:right-handed parallel beta-helix repeat-containing protein [Methylosinus trichosporium OB3b]|uniref:Right-handed parallel beta-helix repeat-containing protein n=3 Tax=Methylocystaceae TaxID=31993 RepID=A0A2D2CXE5_METT3|nr:right-handed parallel beta-helix repeat-containing protein [Methylosinus trichosporium OB3b]
MRTNGSWSVIAHAAKQSRAMGRPLCRCVASLLALWLVATAEPSSASAPAAAARCRSIFVSPEGSDLASGDSGAAAVRTPARAIELLRALRRSGAAEGAVCLRFAPGAYPLRSPLMLDAETSGDAGASTILIAAASGAVFSGGVALPPPRVTRRGFWRWDVAGACPLEVQRSLFVNDERRMRSRTPKQGFLRVEAEVARGLETGAPRDKFSYAPEFDASRYTFDAGSEVVAFHYWSASRFPVFHIDAKNRILTVDGVTSHTDVWARFGKGEDYYFENIDRDALEPGEWAQSGTKIDYRPTSSEESERAAGRLRAVLPCTPQLLEIGDGAHDVVIDAIGFAHTGDLVRNIDRTPAQAGVSVKFAAAIAVEDASRISFDHIDVFGVASLAMSFARAAHCPVVTNSRMTDLGGGAVIIGDASDAYTPVVAAKDDPETCGVTLKNNVMSDGGKIWPGAAAVWIGDADRNKIVENDIRRFRYTGISLGWIWGGRHRTRHNVIEHNRISEIGMGAMSDLGGIYTLSDLEGSTIRHNVIDDVVARRYGGFGIYLDRGTSGVTVENNEISSVSNAGIALHMAGGNTLVGNEVCVREGLPPLLVIKPGQSPNKIEEIACPSK